MVGYTPAMVLSEVSGAQSWRSRNVEATNVCVWVLYLPLIMNDSNAQQTRSEDWSRV